MTQLLTITTLFPGLNAYISALNNNRYKGAQMKRDFTAIAAIEAKNKLEPVNVPVNIHFEWIEKNRRRDPDNIIFAKKFILDGLVTAGIIKSDSHKWIHSFSDKWRLAEEGESTGVIVLIEEVV